MGGGNDIEVLAGYWGTLKLSTFTIGRTASICLTVCAGMPILKHFSLLFSSALSFTCVWYCTIVTSGMGYILLTQLLNISYNVTEREARIALRENTGRRLLWGMIVDTGQYNNGFLRNWFQFLSLRSPLLQHSIEDIVWSSVITLELFLGYSSNHPCLKTLRAVHSPVLKTRKQSSVSKAIL